MPHLHPKVIGSSTHIQLQFKGDRRTQEANEVRLSGPDGARLEVSMKKNAHKVLDVYKLSPEEEAMLAWAVLLP